MPTNKKLMKKHEVSYTLYGVKGKVVLAVWEPEVADFIRFIENVYKVQNVQVKYNLTLTTGKSMRAAENHVAKQYQALNPISKEQRQKLDAIWF